MICGFFFLLENFNIEIKGLLFEKILLTLRNNGMDLQEIMKLSNAYISEIYCSWTMLSAVSVGNELPQWKENIFRIH